MVSVEECARCKATPDFMPYQDDVADSKDV
jgi:hypothetical protein